MAELRNYRGTKDSLGADAILRQRVRTTIRQVLEEYGYEPLETPAIELRETLEGKGGEEIAGSMYLFSDPENTDIGLIFDQTLPLARVMGMYAQIPLPYKRYVDGRSYRADDPGPGRFREFEQFDFDIVGTESMLADGEVIAVLASALRRLGIQDFCILLNNRKLLSAIDSWLNINSVQHSSVLRGLDKLAKLGRVEVERQLTTVCDATREEERITSEQAKQLLDFADSLSPLSNADALVRIKSELKSEICTTGVAELRCLLEAAAAMGVPDSLVKVDFKLARGLAYYTGPIYESVATSAVMGSIAGGGRYDKLIRDLSGGAADYPATGCSFGIDRICEVLHQLNLVPEESQGISDILVAPVGNESVALEAQRLAADLRRAGYKAETFLAFDPAMGFGKQLAAQLNYAGRKNIPLAVIIGETEIEQGVVTVRQVTLGKTGVEDRAAKTKAKQRTVSRGELLDTLAQLRRKEG